MSETIDFENDIDRILEKYGYRWQQLDGSTFFITGATGLIGSWIVYTLAQYCSKFSKNVSFVLLVRNIDKARDMFGKWENIVNIKYLVGNVMDPIVLPDNVDYIIHGASITASKMFSECPVETIDTIVNGTKNVLEFASEKRVKSFVFLSTMEIYGVPLTDDKIKEDDYRYIDHLSARSSYPQAKRMAENLCAAFKKEYNLPVKIARLTQTFGQGVNYLDTRVFAEFARCVIECQPIVLHTKGDTKRNYLYCADAVSGIMTVLLSGTDGEAYNIANEDTYCSIREMAEMVADKCAHGRINILYELEGENQFGYAPTLHMNLDTTKIKQIGWEPYAGLEYMYNTLIKSMRMSLEDEK